MQPYPRSPDLVWPGHLHGTGCLSARAVGTGFPTVGLCLCLGPGCGWVWVLLTPASPGWGLGWVCLGTVLWCCLSFAGFLWCSWACVLGLGLGCAPPFLGGLLGCVFCAFFFFCFLVSVAGCPCPGPCGLSPHPLSFGLGCWLFFFSWCVSACFGAPFPGGPLFLAWCCRFWLGGAPVPLWGSCLRCLLGGGFGRLLCCWRAVWWLWAVFAPPPLGPLFFFSGGGLPVFLSAFPGLALGWWGCGWCVVWLVPRHSWRRFLCAPPRHSWLGFAAGGGGRSSPLLAEAPGCGSPPPLAGVRWRRWCVVCGVWRWCVGGVVAGVWCGWSLATPGGGPCVLLPATPGWVSLPVGVGVPGHSWLRLPGAVPRHSWLGSAGGGGVWCVVCGGGVLVGLWLVCGVVGPSPLLAEVPVCYSPPLLAGFRCRWWWAFLATPG